MLHALHKYGIEDVSIIIKTTVPVFIQLPQPGQTTLVSKEIIGQLSIIKCMN